MSPKQVRRIALIVGVLFFVVGSFSLALAASEKITIKAVSAWPKTVFEVQNFMKFLDIVKTNVAAKAPGQFQIQYLGGPEVMPNNEQVEALRNGLVDMVFTTTGYYVSVVPAADALNVSWLLPWEERARGVNKLLNKIHEKKINAYYLGRIGPGIPFTLYLTKPIKSADLTGLSIRCSPTHVAFLKKLGAKPVVIPPPDVYTSLERGVVQGLIWPAALITDWGWDKVVKYTVDPPFYNGANVILINLNTWKKLPENIQKILLASEEQAEHYAIDRGKKRIRQGEEKMAKEGMKVIKLPKAEAKKLVDAANSSLWAVVMSKSPETGSKLKELFTK